MPIRGSQLEKIREMLNEEFAGKCAYCGSSIDTAAHKGVIENFYPKSKYPQMSFQLDNLLLACQICDRSKADEFPVDDNDEPMLLNPRTDNYQEHIRLEKKTGLLNPITNKGKITIELLNLNRMALVEQRKLKELERELFENFQKVNKDYYANFTENIKLIRSLIKVTSIANESISQYLKNMLYANIITCIEAYLSDAFKVTVTSKREFLRRFVETFHGFRSEKFELRELFSQYEQIDKKATKAIIDIIYHDLPKVKGMYEDTLDITFPSITVLVKAVSKRHDFVHRNGKTKDGKAHVIELSDIEALCKEAEVFIENIDNQINDVKKR